MCPSHLVSLWIGILHLPFARAAFVLSYRKATSKTFGGLTVALRPDVYYNTRKRNLWDPPQHS